MRLLAVLSILFLLSCGTAKHHFEANRKYNRTQLERDYTIFQTVLEEQHPSLYWYTSKDSMDYYFQWGRNAIKDSMSETDFRKLLSYVAAKINCGHTSIRASKNFIGMLDTQTLSKAFPLSFKIWPDTMVVAINLNRNDSILKRGTLVTGINGWATQTIIDSLFQFIPTDGYNLTHKYQTLSNRGVFGSLYGSIFGYKDSIAVDYLDSVGIAKKTIIPVYKPINDTARRPANRTPNMSPPPRPSQDARLNAVRLLQIDTASKSAMMTLNSFSKGYKLRKFFRHSFRALRKNDIEHLIIDVRSNGGGTIGNSTLLTKYISDHRFKLADSLYAINKGGTYRKHIESNFWNRMFLFFFTKKKNKNNYHFTYFEKKYFKPKKKNHYDKEIYLLNGGNSFSATTLVGSMIKGQKNVTLIGEETGGAEYGNSAWIIPDLTLPETKVRVRIPYFRLVINKNTPKNGLGLQPDVLALPTQNAVLENRDFKLEKAMELIMQKKLQKTVSVQ